MKFLRPFALVLISPLVLLAVVAACAVIVIGGVLLLLVGEWDEDIAEAEAVTVVREAYA